MRALVGSVLVVALGLLAFVPSAEAINVKKAAGALRAAEKKSDYDKMRDIIVQLGGSDDKKAVNLIVGTLNRVPVFEISEQAVDALAALGSEKCGKIFDKLFKSRKTDRNLLAVALAAAQKMNDERGEGWLVKAVESKDYFLYRNAIPALVELRSKAAIPALIDLLEIVGYKPRTESYLIRDALLTLTGQDLEGIEDWRSFWEVEKDTFDPKSLDKDTGATGVVRKSPKGFKPPKFFGVEVRSSRVVFIVDISGSMQLWDPGDEKIGEGPEHKTRERLARMKFHLEKAIMDLPDYATFNVIAYSDSNRVFNPKGAVPANRKWKSKATEFVRNLKAFGATHTDAAIKIPFEDTKVDTVFLLTDGAPSRMGKKPKELIKDILEDVRRRNRISGIKIFTFGFATEGQYPPGIAPPPPPRDDEDAVTLEDFINFLKQLAKENGGEYTAVE